MRAVTPTVADVPYVVLDGLYRHVGAVVLLTVLQVGDVISTHLGLQSGMYEANPLAATLMAAIGEGGTYTTKLAWMAAFVFLVCLLATRYPRVWRAVHAVNVIMSVIVFSNLAQFLILR